MLSSQYVRAAKFLMSRALSKTHGERVPGCCSLFTTLGAGGNQSFGRAGQKIHVCCLGLEPRSAVQQARILPLNHQCLGLLSSTRSPQKVAEKGLFFFFFCRGGVVEETGLFHREAEKN